MNTTTYHNCDLIPEVEVKGQSLAELLEENRRLKELLAEVKLEALSIHNSGDCGKNLEDLVELLNEAR